MSVRGRECIFLAEVTLCQCVLGSEGHKVRPVRVEGAACATGATHAAHAVRPCPWTALVRDTIVSLFSHSRIYKRSLHHVTAVILIARAVALSHSLTLTLVRRVRHLLKLGVGVLLEEAPWPVAASCSSWPSAIKSRTAYSRTILLNSARVHVSRPSSAHLSL